MSDSSKQRQSGQRELEQPLHTAKNQDREVNRIIGTGNISNGMGNTEHQQHEGRISGHREESSQNSERPASESARSMQTIWMGNTELHGHDASQIGRSIVESETESRMLQPERSDSIGRICNSESDKKHPCTTGGLYAKSSYERTVNDWSDPDWLYCRDEKYRPIKSGIEPLANGLPRGVGYSSDPSEPIDADNTQEARVMRLKGYGNAIVPQVAASFIKAFMEAT